MRPVGLVLFLVVVVSGAGCTRSGDDTSNSERDGVDAVMFAGAKRVAPRPEVANVQATSISAARSGSGRNVEILFTTGEEPCGILQRIETTEAEDSIYVSVFLGTDPAAFSNGNVTCPDIGVPATAKVELRQPLGNRRVVDGATGQAVPLTR